MTDSDLREEVHKLIIKAGEFLGTHESLHSVACIEVAIDHAIWLGIEVDRLTKENTELRERLRGQDLYWKTRLENSWQREDELGNDNTRLHFELQASRKGKP